MDLSQFSSAQIEQLKAALLTDTSGRTSEFRPRQLHNLTLAPSATDARPLFVWSADGDRNLPVGAGTPYPKLLWSADGVEITVRSREEEQAQIAQGYVTAPPLTGPVDPMVKIQAELDALSEEDRALVLQAQHQDRRSALQAKLANLTEAQLESLLAGAGAKRGRPRKAVA